jgi:RNA polymerase sigma factor (sigma-70 family)
MRVELGDRLTAEERVRQIRAALDHGARSTAEHHFAALLRASEGSMEWWVRRTVALTPALHGASPYVIVPICEDLRQELALYLWERIADPTRHEMAWERTYGRALKYAQQHVASNYMCQAGYWLRNRTVKQPTRGTALPLLDEYVDLMEAPDALSAVDLADLSSLVVRLPAKERSVVVLRYWHDMRMQDIARVLGCTERTVSNRLRVAQQRLATWYEGLPQKGAVREL